MFTKIMIAIEWGLLEKGLRMFRYRGAPLMHSRGQISSNKVAVPGCWGLKWGAVSVHSPLLGRLMFGLKHRADSESLQ